MQSSWVVSVARQSHVEGIGQIQNVDEHPDEDDGQHGASLAEHLPVQSLVLHEHQSGQNKTKNKNNQLDERFSCFRGANNV